jgi:aspartate/methionine/tyrosine aminotransferase
MRSCAHAAGVVDASSVLTREMIIINNPSNPTGSTIPSDVLQAIVDFAKARNIIVLSDEVYSPLYHSVQDGEAPPSILALDYERTISTGSCSKAFALAGIRVGWIASRDKAIIEALAAARDYTTISVSQLDDQVASYALSEAVLPSLLKRNIEMARTNLELLSVFVNRHSSVCSWHRPTAGTTALIKFRRKGVPVDDAQFVLDLLAEEKVLFMPATPCFGLGKDFNGYVRVGYVCHTSVLEKGLQRLASFVGKHLV